MNPTGTSTGTTPRIAVLASDVADRIAAGEVVERPASVVKELVENALDAGATAVDIDVREGGRALIRVSDDGHGMDRANAARAIERHATSKIRDAEDLVGVTSFGFRGERLHERAQPESGAADHECGLSVRACVREPPGRIARPPRRRPALLRIGDVDPVVRHAPTFREGRLGRAEIEAAIDLPRVRADDPRAVPLGQRERESRLPRPGRPRDDAQRRLSAVRSADRAHPSPVGGSSRAHARRAPATWCAPARRRARASPPARADRPT